MRGKVLWIGVRPERRAEVEAVTTVMADPEIGLHGDYATRSNRHITLISAEQLSAAARVLGRESIEPATTRRNVLMSGLDFDSLHGALLRIGEVEVEITGPCLPCQRMDETLGEGGRRALAVTHAGGLTGRIKRGGSITVGDTVYVLSSNVPTSTPISTADS